MIDDVDIYTNKWLDFYKLPTGSSEQSTLTWVFDEMSEAISNRPDIAWKVALKALELDSSDTTRENVAAAILEHLFCENGEKVIGEFEEEVTKNSNLLLAAKMVSLSPEDTEVYGRFIKAIEG